MLKQKILGILVNASSFCFNPSKHYSDSKSNIVTFRNNVRTFFKYFAIMLFSWVNTQNVIRLMNKNAQDYSTTNSKDIGLTVFVWNWKFEKSSFDSFSKRKNLNLKIMNFGALLDMMNISHVRMEII